MICPTLWQAATQSINNTIVAKIPQRAKHFIDDRTVAGTVTLVAHGK